MHNLRFSTALFRVLLISGLAFGQMQLVGQEKSAKDGASESRYEHRAGSPDGIDTWYMGRQIAHVMGHQAADWLERPEREEEERPGLVLDAIKLKPGDAVADIGSGTGYFS